MTPLLADWIPFVDPINVFHVWWYLLLIPLSFGISVVYRALKMGNLDRFWRAVAMMTVQIVLVMAALAVALVVLVQLTIPLLPAE
jgi:cytochrome c biogenesis protein ResB